MHCRWRVRVDALVGRHSHWMTSFARTSTELRDHQAQGLRCLEVNRKNVLRGLVDRYIRWANAFEDLRYRVAFPRRVQRKPAYCVS